MTISVSIVEDDERVGRIFESWLQSMPGCRLVRRYFDGESAIEDLPGSAPNVVLVDVNLPGVNGVECVRRVKAQMPETQFVMVTVYEDADHIFDALSAGATGYLLKQVSREELFQAIKEVHGGGSPMTTSIARKVVQSYHQAVAGRQAVEGLSPREQEVLQKLAQGFLYKEIAEALGVSVMTINTHIRRIYEKLHVRSRSQAVAKLMLVPPPGRRTAPEP